MFIHVPRTGGTAVREALGIPQRHHEHLPARFFKEEELAESFAVVRNPWDRAVSLCAFLYREKLKGLPLDVLTFRGWLEGGALDPKGRVPTMYDGTPFAIPVTACQVEWLKGEDGVWKVPRVIRFERLREEMAAMFHVEPSRSNASCRMPQYIDYYRLSDIMRANRIWLADVLELGYCFGDSRADSPGRHGPDEDHDHAVERNDEDE